VAGCLDDKVSEEADVDEVLVASCVTDFEVFVAVRRFALTEEAVRSEDQCLGIKEHDLSVGHFLDADDLEFALDGRDRDLGPAVLGRLRVACSNLEATLLNFDSLHDRSQVLEAHEDRAGIALSFDAYLSVGIEELIEDVGGVDGRAINVHSLGVGVSRLGDAVEGAAAAVGRAQESVNQRLEGSGLSAGVVELVGGAIRREEVGRDEAGVSRSAAGSRYGHDLGVDVDSGDVQRLAVRAVIQGELLADRETVDAVDLQKARAHRAARTVVGSEVRAVQELNGNGFLHGLHEGLNAVRENLKERLLVQTLTVFHEVAVVEHHRAPGFFLAVDTAADEGVFGDVGARSELAELDAGGVTAHKRHDVGSFTRGGGGTLPAVVSFDVR
jgi:hypothetical protein